MKREFRQVVQKLNRADIYESVHAPAGITPPEAINHFFQEFTAQQLHQGCKIEQGFLFGGGIGDLHLGLKPKDYDLYIASPDIISRLNSFENNKGDSYRSHTDDVFAEVLGSDFVASADEDSLEINNSDAFGLTFAFNAAYAHDGKRYGLDIRIAEKAIDMKEFLSYVSAPIMAVGATLGNEKKTYAFHKDFENHARDKILCTPNTDRAEFVEKARRKGLTLMKPPTMP